MPKGGKGGKGGKDGKDGKDGEKHPPKFMSDIEKKIQGLVSNPNDDPIPSTSSQGTPSRTVPPLSTDSSRDDESDNDNDRTPRITGGADVTREEAVAFFQTLNITDFNSYPGFSHEMIHEVYTFLHSAALEDNLELWRHELSTRLDLLANREIEALEIPRPFVDQMLHMLELCNLSRRDWDVISKFVVFDTSGGSIDLIKRMVYSVRYIGFDPANILKRLVRLNMSGRITPLISFTLDFESHGESSTWTFTNHESLYKDMLFLVIIFLQRGAVVSKIAKKSAKDFHSVLSMLLGKYTIRHEAPRRRAEAIGPEVITLPRIAACMPQLTTTLYHRGFGRAIANFAEFGECPAAIFAPMFSSVVRKSYIHNNLKYNMHPQLILIAILIDNVLHMRDKVTPLDQIWTYYLASYQSSVVVDLARIEQCNIFGVTIEGYFSPTILNLRDHCIRRIRELRPHERMEDFIREMNEI